MRTQKNRLPRLAQATLLTLISCTTVVAKKVKVTLQDIKSMCSTLHTNIVADNFVPDVIIGLSRGGLMPLSFLAGEANFNNRNTRIINIQSYNDNRSQETLQLTFPIHTQDLQHFSSILIVDDLVDSGNSLDFVLKALKGRLPNATIKTAVLFYKKSSKIMPDYFVEETSDWIVFPWEK